MTESELRNQVAGLAEEYAKSGKVYEWSSELDRLIDIYNAHKPLTRNIKYSKDLKPNGWCALFLSDLFILSDLSDLIVTEIGAYEFMANAKKAGQWKPRGTYAPKRGDIVVYAYQEETYTQYHVGIVTNADANIIYTTEGNVQDRVLMLAHKPDDKTILGFWAVDYASAASTDILVSIPAPPKANGTYRFEAVVSNKKFELKWVK